MEVVKDNPGSDTAPLTDEQKEDLNVAGQEALDKVKELNMQTLATITTVAFRYASQSLKQGELFMFEELCKKMHFVMRGETPKPIQTIVELEKLAAFIRERFPNEPKPGETPIDVVIRILALAFPESVPVEDHK